MNEIDKQLLALIKEYISCSKYLYQILKDTYDIKGETLLRARRTNLIPKEGVLPDGYSFSFHGGGCYFEFDGGSIDVDFGPDDRCDGFDSVRLYNFLCTLKKGNYNCLTSINSIEETLNALLKKGHLIQPKWFPNPELFYLAL